MYPIVLEQRGGLGGAWLCGHWCGVAWVWAHGNGYMIPILCIQSQGFPVKVTVASGFGGHDCGRGYMDEKSDIHGFQAIDM